VAGCVFQSRTAPLNTRTKPPSARAAIQYLVLDRTELEVYDSLIGVSPITLDRLEAMRVRQTAQDLPEHRVQRLRELCREAGIRFTPQRLKIFQSITGSTRHPTADALWNGLRKAMPGLSRNTVYRNLETFERMGLVVRLPIDADSARFDGNPEKHHHVICRQCGKLDDVRWPALEGVAPPQKIKGWGEVDRRHVQFSGVCRDCLAKTRRKSRL